MEKSGRGSVHVCITRILPVPATYLSRVVEPLRVLHLTISGSGPEAHKSSSTSTPLEPCVVGMQVSSSAQLGFGHCLLIRLNNLQQGTNTMGDLS